MGAEENSGVKLPSIEKLAAVYDYEYEKIENN